MCKVLMWVYYFVPKKQLDSHRKTHMKFKQNKTSNRFSFVILLHNPTQNIAWD